MEDVPSPIDLKNMDVARAWMEEAELKRPYRRDIFRRVAEELRRINAVSVLELGSRPGLLAREVTNILPSLRYKALDNSPAMHSIAKETLGHRASTLEFLVGDFKDERWHRELGLFDAVITNQAVHEIRHKDRAPLLFHQILSVLNPQGTFLYCDHVADAHGMADNQLFMSEVEQERGLVTAGFINVQRLLRIGSLALWIASKA